MNKAFKNPFLHGALILLLTACASATPEAETRTGPGNIVVTGALNLTDRPSDIWGYEDESGKLVIVLELEAEASSGSLTGVVIELPKDIQPGDYSIDYYVYSRRAIYRDWITAWFSYTVDGQDYFFGSTDGSIELTSTGDAYSGSFTFNAAPAIDPTQSVIVSGNFEGVSLGKLVAENQTAPGQVVITGALSLTFTPSETWISEAESGRHAIVLELETEAAWGFPRVTIWVPEGIQPGNYSIGNSLNGIRAEFKYNNKGYIFWSIDGSIELTATGDAYSGSFTFNATDPGDFSKKITVIGNFEGVAVGKMAAEETATNELATEETATETVDSQIATATQTAVPQTGTGRIVVRGNVKLSYDLGYTYVYTDESFQDHIELLLEPPQSTIHRGQNPRNPVGMGSGVVLYIPAYIEPGTYDIGNFVTYEGYIFALFHFGEADGDVRNYSSTRGELILTETGSVFSGSFSFKAKLQMGEGMVDENNNISVEGKFRGVVRVIEERG